MTSVSTLKTYIQNNYNILLQGLHGVGKTQMLMQAVGDLKHEDGTPWVLGYWSAATLDPFVDLTGIPYVSVLSDGTRVLESVRPHRIDEVDVVFFDEFNRAEDKTMNALFEMVQFHTINHEPLPRLKAIVAAQNPPDSGDDNITYAVNSLDPAMVDRFHVVIDIKAKPDQSYLSGKLGADVAAALMDWYRERTNNADYISPRRMETLGLVWKSTPTREAIHDAMPPGGTYDATRLFELLKQASGQSSVAVDYLKAEPNFIRAQAMPSAVAAWLDGKPDEDRAHVLSALYELVGVEVLVDKWEPVLEKMTEAEISAMVAGWGPSKKSNFRKKAKQAKSTNKDLAEKLLDTLAKSKPATA